MGVLVLLFAVAACLGASSVQASKGVQYGIQDDAWLEYGPGTLNDRLATFKHLGVPLVRFTLHWNEIALQRPAKPASPRDPAYDWRAPTGSCAAWPSPRRLGPPVVARWSAPALRRAGGGRRTTRHRIA